MILSGLIATAKNEILAQGFIEMAKSFFRGIGAHAGKKAPEALDDYMVVKFGLKTEDERLYNAAKRLMKPNDRIRLGKKLMLFGDGVSKQLADERNNYFRVCLPLKDPVAAASILTGYAQTSPEAWKRECDQMGFLFDHDGVSAQNIIDAAAAKQQQLSTSFNAHPVRGRVKTYRDKARKRANDQSW
jgi:hypothetical protein